MSKLRAKFSLRHGIARARDRAILLMSLGELLRLSPLVTFILISFTFLLLIILRTPHPVFFLSTILSSPLQPGLRCKLSLVADLATPQIWWLSPLICRALWMVPPFLSFPHIPFRDQSLCSASWSSLWLFTNPYGFPPIILNPQVLRFVRTHCFTCTIVIPWCRAS